MSKFPEWTPMSEGLPPYDDDKWYLVVATPECIEGMCVLTWAGLSENRDKITHYMEAPQLPKVLLNEAIDDSSELTKRAESSESFIRKTVEETGTGSMKEMVKGKESE